MADHHIQQLGLIGCGLMGGSFALAAKRAGCVQRVVGYSASPTSRDKALALGAIDVSASNLEQAVQDSDVVLLAIPVNATLATLQAIAPHLKPDALLMDVGSTKSQVIEQANLALGARIGQFVPAHPIAGKESAGIEHADARLYDQRSVILTPLPQNPPEWIQRATAIWQALGSQVVQLDALQHDQALAAVSHLPHLLAFAAVQALAEQPQGVQFMGLAGPGFRDFSRIAASDPTVWRDIFMSNTQALLQQSQLFRAQLERFEAAIEQGNGTAVHALIARASQVRQAWTLPTHNPQPANE